jgi:hypothetical protein
VTVLVVSYEDQDALRKTLEGHKIEVVISTIGKFDPQVNLIRACAESGSVKRFAPSEWLLDYEKNDEYVPIMNRSEENLSENNTRVLHLSIQDI